MVKPQNLHDGIVKEVPQYISKEVEIVPCNGVQTIELIAKMADKDASLHINTALKSSSDINHLALRYLLKNGYDVFSLPQEKFQLIAVKRYLNYVKWWWYLNHTFRKRIRAFGLCGNDAERCFLNVGVKPSKLFQYIYITPSIAEMPHFTQNKQLHFVFVGMIDKRKNIIPFAKYLMEYESQAYTFDIYGTSYLDEELAALVKDVPNITFHGKKNYDEVRAAMSGADYLVLPSIYDGWGAVANEGLQSGCRLLVSRQCGCCSLVEDHPELGYIFDANNLSSLQVPLKKIFQEGTLSEEQHRNVSTWSDTHISPPKAASYLDNQIRHYFNGDSKPQCPWL